MDGVKPDSLPRRGFHYRSLAAAGARFVERDGAAVAEVYAGRVADPVGQCRELALIDLSPLPRSGYKGRDCVPWLQGQGLEIEAASNRAYRQDDGLLAARLGPGEVLLLPSPMRAWDGALDAAWQESEKLCFPVPRREASLWFRLTGTHAASALAKICGVDLRPGVFADLQIAQTSVARMNATLIREDVGATLAYHVIADSASAAYLWDCLVDAIDEFGGAVVGLEALQRVAEG